ASTCRPASPASTVGRHCRWRTRRSRAGWSAWAWTPGWADKRSCRWPSTSASARAGTSGWARCATYWGSDDSRLAPVVARDQLAPDQHAPDLVGACADRIQLGIAQDAAGGVLVDVAVAAQRLDRLQRHLHRGLAGVQQAAGGVDARAVAGVVVARLLVGERPR